MIANKHATLHLQHFRNDLVLFNESYPINPVSYSCSPPIHRRGNALSWNWFLHLSIFTSLYILKLKVERENIRFKIPTTAIDVKFSGYCLNCKEYQLDSSKSKFIEKIHPEFHNSSDFESGITAETTMEERSNI